MGSRIARLSWATPVVLSALLSGCASGNIDYDFDPAAVPRFGTFESYAWLHRPQGDDPRVDNDLIEARVVRAADAVFAAKGGGA